MDNQQLINSIKNLDIEDLETIIQDIQDLIDKKKTQEYLDKVIDLDFVR
jgi:hypothetical protein